jgi:outer membrane protein insertion porin family
MKDREGRERGTGTRRFLAYGIVLVFIGLLMGTARVGAEPSGSSIVQDIEVTGTQRIEPDVILLKIRTAKGSVADPRIVREDIRSIMKTGYFRNVTVEDVPVAGGVKIVFRVEERPTIREIRFEGNDELEKKDLEGALSIQPNQFLNVAKVKEDLAKIRKLYANEGYFLASVEYEIESQPNNQVNVVFAIQENEEIKVRRIVFMGNRAFSDKELRKVVETKKKGLLSFLTSSGVYKEDVLRDDVTRLTLFYLDHGYLQFSAEKPLTLTADDGMYICFVLNEGAQYTVKDVRWENLNEQEAIVAQENQKLRSGQIFSREKLQQDILTMTEFFTDRGYAFAEITPLYYPDEAALTVDVVYKVNKGTKVRIGEIHIRGNTKTRDKVIRREMELVEGEWYSGSHLRDSRSEINRLGFFENVNVTTEPAKEPDQLDVVVDVKEGQTGTLSGGAGFSSTDQFVFMANITQSNLFGRAQVVSLNAEVGGTRQNFSLSFTEPWLFDIPLSAGFDVYRTENEYTDFTRNALGGTVRLGYEFFRNIRGNVMYKYEDVEITDVSVFAPITLKGEEGRSTTSSVTLYGVHDTLDNPMYPLKGWMNVASVEFAGTIFGGDNDFIKVRLDTGYYQPLFWGTTLHARARLGLGYGLYGDQLPVFERFFVGGISTVRGYDVRSLGPSALGVVIGGNKELIFNLEYIFPLVPQVKLRGLVFFDAGNAFSEDEGLSFSALRLSAGGGFQWFSPMGPLTFVLGFPIDRRPGEDPSAVQFSIGAPF